MAKLAILYTGLPDNFEENSKTHKILFDHFDTDVYVSTWDKIDASTQIFPFIPSQNIVATYSNFHMVSELINYRIEQTLFNADIHLTALHKCMLGYYTMDSAYRSIQFPNRYDVILRLRFDVCIHENMLDPAEMEANAKSRSVIHGWRDRFNYGHSYAMRIASTVFSNSPSWYIGNLRPNIEMLWEDYLRSNEIVLNENFREFTLKKSESDQRNQMFFT